MTPLPPPPAADDWPAEIFEAAKGEFNGELRIVKPGSPGAYDPITDTYTGGAADIVVMDWRPARAQIINQPIEMHDGNSWDTERKFLFQHELREGDAHVHKGLVAQFRGGNDPTLELFAFQVTSAVNSSHAALRTLRAVTEAGVAQ